MGGLSWDLDGSGAPVATEPAPAPWGSRLALWAAAARFAPTMAGARLRTLAPLAPGVARAEPRPGRSPDGPADLARALEALAEEPSPWFGTRVIRGQLAPDASDWGSAMAGLAERTGAALLATGLVAPALVSGAVEAVVGRRGELAGVREFCLVHGDLGPDVLLRSGAGLVLDTPTRACLGDPALDLAAVWLAPDAVQERVLAAAGPALRERHRALRDTARGHAAVALHLLRELHERAVDLERDGLAAAPAFARAEGAIVGADPAADRARVASLALVAELEEPADAVAAAARAARGEDLAVPAGPRAAGGEGGPESLAAARRDLASAGVGAGAAGDLLDAADAVGRRLGGRLPPSFWSEVAALARSHGWQEAGGASRRRADPADLSALRAA